MLAEGTLPAKTLESLCFDNAALRELPVDPSSENRPRQVLLLLPPENRLCTNINLPLSLFGKVPNSCFSRVKPTPLDNPQLVVVSEKALGLLELQSEMERVDFVDYFSGNKLFPGTEPAAHCYCGHQFGYFSGQVQYTASRAVLLPPSLHPIVVRKLTSCCQLGDGATMYLGEVLNSKGQRWEIQFKGAGKTPYSRTADGRKVLRSSLREFLCSEVRLLRPCLCTAAMLTSVPMAGDGTLGSAHNAGCRCGHLQHACCQGQLLQRQP